MEFLTNILLDDYVDNMMINDGKVNLADLGKAHEAKRILAILQGLETNG